MVRAAEAGDHAVVVENDFAFHRLLCELYGNRHLLNVLERILDGLYREVWTMRTRYPWQSDDVWEKHEGIINCLQFGDAAQAEQLLAEHLRAGEQRVLSRKPPPSR
jgi:DNA-binding GntR family transcriptional regulator